MLKSFHRSLFIDSADVEEIKKWNSTGVIDGVTTNQYIMLKDGVKPSNVLNTIKRICSEMKNKPVSVELTNSNATIQEMTKEAIKLNSIAKNVIIKVPVIPDTLKSLEVINKLADKGISVNATLLMTFEQMILAILATRLCKKPSFVSLFWGRTIEDHARYRTRSDFMSKYPMVGFESIVNSSPKSIVEAAVSFLNAGNLDNPKIIVGSIRTASMIGEAFASGAHIVTATPDKLYAMLFSQRTIETNDQFNSAWKELQRKKN